MKNQLNASKKMTVEVLVKAIHEYRSEGVELMKRFGYTFGYDISVMEQCEELLWIRDSKVPRKGAISKGVNYAFHGDACSFYKKKTQQHIEVILSNPPKFGKIDAWFLKSYLDSTKEYTEFAEDTDWLELKRMLRELYRNGLVEEIK